MIPVEVQVLQAVEGISVDVEVWAPLGSVRFVEQLAHRRGAVHPKLGAPAIALRMLEQGISPVLLRTDREVISDG